MENKQTAVEWLIKNLMINGLIRLTQDQHSLYKELTDEAKAMEKEQIIDTYIHVASEHCDFLLHSEIKQLYTKQSEQYYNETYTND